MTTALTIERIGPTRDAMIEALSAINAAAEVFDYNAGNKGEDPVALFFWAAEKRLRDFVFGATTGEEDPVEVEVCARSSELQADAFELQLKDPELHERIVTLRAVAPRYRERGTVDVTFQIEEASDHA